MTQIGSFFRSFIAAFLSLCYAFLAESKQRRELRASHLRRDRTAMNYYTIDSSGVVVDDRQRAFK